MIEKANNITVTPAMPHITANRAVATLPGSPWATKNITPA